jgi:hypothetical protein
MDEKGADDRSTFEESARDPYFGIDVESNKSESNKSDHITEFDLQWSDNDETAPLREE